MKLSFDPDKHTWRPSPLLGQIVLVTTLNADGGSNIAPKSWVSMMAFEPPVLALGCNVQHWTGRNILERSEFVVNVLGADRVEQAWQVHTLPHPRSVEAAGFTPLPAERVQPPRVAECPAHLECVLDQHLCYGDELVVLGRIVAVSMDLAAVRAADPYAQLKPCVFLESGTYGVIERSCRVDL
jgi:flavin reductase (DIM6/NTAB) family NADH-FMN oxidoreductase RutF